MQKETLHQQAKSEQSSRQCFASELRSEDWQQGTSCIANSKSNSIDALAELLGTHLNINSHLPTNSNIHILVLTSEIIRAHPTLKKAHSNDTRIY